MSTTTVANSNLAFRADHLGFIFQQFNQISYLSLLDAILGGQLSNFALSGAKHILPYVLTVAVASVIYIVVGDFLPLKHRQRNSFELQSALIGVEVMMVPLVGQWVHRTGAITCLGVDRGVKQVSDQLIDSCQSAIPYVMPTRIISSSLFPDSERPPSSPPFPRDTKTSATYLPVMCS